MFEQYPVIFSLFLCLLLVYSYYRKSTRKIPPVIAPAPAETAWHHLTVEYILMQLNSSAEQGLNSAQIQAQGEGLNRLAEKPPTPIWRLLIAQVQSVLILVLVLAACVSAVIGHISDGIVILIVVAINTVLGFYQEYQAEQSLLALKKMLTLHAKVRRNGEVQLISAEQLVVGDIVLLEAGNKIPADGRLIRAHSVEVDESSLTGESVPVSKQIEILPEQTVLAERSNMLYMNNALTRGRAEMVVTAIGMATEIGKLAQLLNESEEGDTPLQIQLDSLGKRLASIALLIVALLFAMALWRGEPLLDTALTAIALAVAAIPEGLPAVVTVTLALGMRRMARQQAIVKRLAAVETLGCTTVICTDKTGTLTVNQMTVRSFYYQDQFYHVSGEGYQANGTIQPELNTAQQTEVLLPLVLCNDSQLQEQSILGDPMEAALLVLALKAGVTQAQANGQYPRIAEIPFDAEHKFMASFHRASDGSVRLFVKGAPEELFKRCVLTAEQHARLLQANTELAQTGLRVLATAETQLTADQFNTRDDLFSYVQGLQFIALLGLIDPPRPEVRSAIALCQQAGIAVKMITGDQTITAQAIAKELGLQGEVIDGQTLAQWDEQTLAAHINSIAVFARTAPEQKMRLVNALKAKGHVTAMTGDGVNDAPALKTADIGIAMGKSGTDVAQSAATMILTDDNFATIINAIREGRGIYDNMVKFIRFQLSTNIGAILCVTFAPLLGLPLPFSAIELLWINIIMDGPPAMSLGVDPADNHIMHRTPRDSRSRILSLARLLNLLSYGVVMLFGTLGVLYYDQLSHDIAHAETLAFTTFVLFQIFNAFNARSEQISAFSRQFFRNKILWASLVGVLLLQIAIVQCPLLQTVFHTTALSEQDWLFAVTIASSVLWLEELRKWSFSHSWRCF